MASIIEKYKFPEKLDEKIYETFEGDPNINEKLDESRLTYLSIHYYGDGYTSCWHHNKGVSIIIDTDEREIYLVGLKNSINEARKDLESLIEEKLELIGIVSKVP